MPQRMQQVLESSDNKQKRLKPEIQNLKPANSSKRALNNAKLAENARPHQQQTEIAIDSDVKLDRFIDDDLLQLTITRSLTVSKKRPGTNDNQTKTAKKITQIERDLGALRDNKLYRQIEAAVDANPTATADEFLGVDLEATKLRPIEVIVPVQADLVSDEREKGKERQEVIIEQIDQVPLTELTSINYHQFSPDLPADKVASKIKSNDSYLSQRLDLTGEQVGKNYIETGETELASRLLGAVDLTSVPAFNFNYNISQDTNWLTTSRQQPKSESSLTTQLVEKDLLTSELGPITSQDYLEGDNEAFILNYDLNSSLNEHQVETRLLYQHQGHNQSLLSSLDSTAADFNVEYSAEFDAMYVTEIAGSEEKDGRFIEFYKNGEIIQNAVDQEEVGYGDLIEARLSEEQRCYRNEINGEEAAKVPNSLEEQSISIVLAL